MTALECLDSPLVLILTRDALKSIPSREALLALLEKYILELPMGLIRDIEQRKRLSQNLCDSYHEIFEENEISVFPAPLSTNQNDIRTLAPRHLAHLVSATIPQLEPSTPKPSESDENAKQIEQEATENLPPHDAVLIAAPTPVFAAKIVATKQETAASPWRRFLQAIRLALAVIALTISSTVLSPKNSMLKKLVASRESSDPKLRQDDRTRIVKLTTTGERQDSTPLDNGRPVRHGEQRWLEREGTQDLLFEFATCSGRAKSVQRAVMGLAQDRSGLCFS